MAVCGVGQPGRYSFWVLTPFFQMLDNTQKVRVFGRLPSWLPASSQCLVTLRATVSGVCLFVMVTLQVAMPVDRQPSVGSLPAVPSAFTVLYE